MKIPALLIFCCISATTFAQQPIKGFTAASSAKQTAIEATFDASLSPQRIGETIKDLSSIPHHVGSPGGKIVAEKILEKYKSYGFDAHIETYYVLFPTPKTRLLELTAPTKYTALLAEPALPEDATSGQQGQLPTYNAYSIDGDVRGQLVYVNYGLPADYEKLALMGISVKGKIAIAKYGNSWRGIKPQVAAEHGAIGCIIYSDPADDGYGQGDVYPKGPYKGEYGVQRGAVTMGLYPGDPLTPGVAATKNAKRLDIKDVKIFSKIPVLPISYHDALPLLSAMGGPVAPAEWRGALPITYHVAGDAVVHLQLAFNWDIVPAYDVIAKIKGSTYPDEWVMRGNHHDAWVNGANDPISGQAALLDEAKALGDLLKTGWKPKRTLVYCSWDGEEPVLLGSTEFVEDHEAELQKKAVVYINTDDNTRGFLDAGGSNALESFVTEISQSVTDPQTKVSIYTRRKARDIIRAASDSDKIAMINRKVNRLDPLGGGSDFETFLQHDGIPTLDLEFSGEGEGGEYHSIYDSYDYYKRFKDPGFEYGVALAKVAGHAVLRMADADVLPFDFRELSATIDRYSGELNELLNNMRKSTLLENQLIAADMYKLSNDPTKNMLSPESKGEVPQLDFTPLKKAIDSLKKSTNALAIVWDKDLQTGSNHQLLNERLYQAEQQLLTAEGLPHRPWFKHTLYASGFYTGYDAKTLPGIREAIEQRNWTEAQEQIAVAAKSILKLAAYLEGK